jgi:hypothetical protein
MRNYVRQHGISGHEFFAFRSGGNSIRYIFLHQSVSLGKSQFLITQYLHKDPELPCPVVEINADGLLTSEDIVYAISKTMSTVMSICIKNNY